jgi:glucose-6-phosphate 1-epimerase
VELARFNGQPALALTAPDSATATVLLHGAHLVSWQPAGRREQLYLSPTSRCGAGASVRGGVPVIFPQFNERGPLPRHGLARTRAWQPLQAGVRGGAALGVLRLTDDESTQALWPQGFEAELTVSVGGDELEIELAVTNTGGSAFEFHAALHTYLRTDDVTQARLDGLQACRYEDALHGGTFAAHGPAALTVPGAIDRIYFDVPRTLTLAEPGRAVLIGMSGFADVVVWNPGPDGAARLADMPGDDWRRMLCVEAACVGRRVRLAPGEDWAGRQQLRAVR